MEERRERGDERAKGEKGGQADFFPCCNPPLSDERDSPSARVPQPTCSTSIYRAASLGLPPPYLLSLFLFFSHPRDLLPGSLVSLSSLPRYFFISTWKRRVFAKEPIFLSGWGASFGVRPRVTRDPRGSENLFSISATPTGSRSIRVMYRVISK